MSNIEAEFIIVGAGVAGVSTAIGLSAIGRTYLLFEQASPIKGIGAGFGLAANAMQAFEHLGIRDDVEQVGHHIDDYNILDEKGAILVAPNTKALRNNYNQGNFVVHRADLHQALLSKVNPDSLHLNKRAVRFEQHKSSITVHFADGSSHHAKYLIVADGVKSPLRQQLLPTASPRYAGYTCWRAVIDNSTINLNKGTETWGKKGRFGMTPLIRNRIYWYACINTTANNDQYRNYRVADLYKNFTDYHSPIPHILQQTKDEDLIWNDIIDIKPLANLAYDNILLIGDAGHATTPNMGQGACQAIEDVAVLMDELKSKTNVNQAFCSFESRRLKRTKYITDTSKFIGEVAQWENPFAIFIRNTLFKLAPAKLSQQRISKLLSVDFMKI